MAEREAEIFGSTEKKAVLSVTIENIDTQPILENLPPGKMVLVEGKTYKASIINYLAYGLFELRQGKSVYVRKHIAPCTHFKLTISHPKTVAPEIDAALQAMISFGGQGARSRNGFGSLHCAALIDHTVVEEAGLKNFTSFSTEAKLFNTFHPKTKWEDALSEIGEIYRSARLKLDKRHDWKHRRFVSVPLDVKSPTTPPHIKNGRHAKPYFLHVNKTENGQYRGQILFLPYAYKAKPSDKTDQSAEYLAVCRKMNEEIIRGMGGVQ